MSIDSLRRRFSGNAEDFDSLLMELFALYEKQELALKETHDELISVKFDNNKLRHVGEDDEVWFWQPEEENHLESLCCPILIMPADLRRLLGEDKKMQRNIIRGSQFDDKTLAELEKHYNAKFVCDTCLVDVKGTKGNFAASVFYTEEAHPEGSNYLALYYKYALGENLGLFVADGICVLDQIFEGIVADNGDVVYSRYRHDFVTSPDGSVSADGGQEYGRFLWTNGAQPDIVKMHVEGAKLVIMESEDDS